MGHQGFNGVMGQGFGAIGGLVTGGMEHHRQSNKLHHESGRHRMLRYSKMSNGGGSPSGRGVHSFNDDKRKRHRRTATEIHRHFACPVVGCSKSYGSEGSMN